MNEPTEPEAINGHEHAAPQEPQAVPILRFHLFTVDALFPAEESPVTFEADIPQPALYQRCYVTQKQKSKLAMASGRPAPTAKVARLVFLVADNAPPVTGSFALVPLKSAVPLDPERFLEVVIDHNTGQPWGLWHAPQKPPAEEPTPG